MWWIVIILVRVYFIGHRFRETKFDKRRRHSLRGEIQFCRRNVISFSYFHSVQMNRRTRLNVSRLTIFANNHNRPRRLATSTLFQLQTFIYVFVYSFTAERLFIVNNALLQRYSIRRLSCSGQLFMSQYKNQYSQAYPISQLINT